MCKLLLMTGITEPLVAKEFMRLIAIPMSKSNQHGIGYTAVKPDGSMFSERWLYNPSFMDYSSVMVPEIAKKLEKYAARLPQGSLLTNYEAKGEVDFTDIRTVTMHTRWATCGREFQNTHPFIDQDVSLVHNGVIRNAEYLKLNKISTCDSEAALQSYINTGVKDDTTKAKSWLNILSGSWAFGILSRNSFGNRILDVVKGSSSLYKMQVEGLGTVYATDKSDVLDVCKEMNLQLINEPVAVDTNSMFRFDAITGELLETIDVKPLYETTTASNPRGHDYYQYGRTIGIGTSSTPKTSTQSNVLPMSSKDKEYNDQMMQDAMGDVFPDIRDFNGKIDFRKVNKYCDNINEPLIDRLDMFDMIYNRELVDQYESLNWELQAYVADCDIMQGFKSARQLIVTLSKESKQKG